MTLDYYRIFYYVARYKSFSNAAEMLGSNQPNITRCMNILENELDLWRKRNYQKQEPRKRADQYRHQRNRHASVPFRQTAGIS